LDFSSPVSSLLQLYVYIIFVRVILSWFPLQPGGVMAQINSFIYAITEPVLGPIRRVMPGVGVGGMGLDFSPLIVLLVVQFFLIPLVRSLGL
jgi:YggT family protein